MTETTHLKNPTLRWISFGLAILGLIDASYLTWVKLTDRPVACIVGLGNCNTVSQSVYSTWNGIPIALIGALSYLAILLLLFFEDKLDFFHENSPLLVLGLCLIGFIYSIYLTYLELAVIKAICPYCVASATLITILLIMAIIRSVPVRQ